MKHEGQRREKGRWIHGFIIRHVYLSMANCNYWLLMRDGKRVDSFLTEKNAVKKAYDIIAEEELVAL